MSKIRNLSEVSWKYEFDIADHEQQVRAGRCERLRRTCAIRSKTGLARSAVQAQQPPELSRVSEGVPIGVPDISRHGQTRLRQRGITVDQVLAILDFGLDQRSHGATRFFLDRKTRTRMAVEMPQALQSLPNLDILVVLGDDGKLITAAHRTKRMRREIAKNFKRPLNN